MVLSLLAGSGAVAAAKMPPKPAALRPAFNLSQEKPEQPPKLAPAAVKVGRLRGGDSPDTDRVSDTAWTHLARPARLLLMTGVFYLCVMRPGASLHSMPTYWKARMQFIIVVEWFCVAFAVLWSRLLWQWF